MSLKLIAKDLYRVTKEIECLEKEISTKSGPERENLVVELMKLKAERDRLKKILEGHKTPPPYRLPR